MPIPRPAHRAPEADGARLVDPPVVSGAGSPACIDRLVDNNRLLRAAFGTTIGDLRLWELIAATRREVLAVAATYTASYRDVDRPTDVADWIARPIVMAGHQPDLFHPGVWLKNFALDAYARQVGGTALNLVVDTDRCARAAVPLPIGTPDDARLEHVPFDGEAPEMPWEERPVVAADTFASFGRRATDLLRPLVPDPILARWWPLVVERAAESHRLGLAIAQARHALEERLGLETLELPVSELVRLPTVSVLMGWLLSRAREVHEAYNAALAAHRRRHRIRGHGRPVPDLVVRDGGPGEGPWFEVPWWIWSRDDPQRRRVYANAGTAGTLLLSDLESLRLELPITPETSPSKWVDALARLEEHRLCLRPRALVTTLVARLLVADVFVHGIGGAAYDRLTDDIVERLTGCEPPRYAVVTGTLHLPLDNVFPGLAGSDPHAELGLVRHRLRDLRYHPERHLPAAPRSPEVEALVRRKWQWIETPPTPTLARRRCHEIRAANEALAARAEPARVALEAHVEPLATRVRATALLRAREYPWCFFPETVLRRFLLLEKG
jgi:hypothetical protein